MSITLAEIWRHPIKSIGAEHLESATLAAGRPMPHDRVWAIAHSASDWDADAPGWVACKNFLRVTHAPALAQVSAAYEPEARRITLRHPARPEITVRPDEPAGAAALCEWVAPIAKGARPGPYRVAHAPDAAMTDVEPPWLSVLSRASLRALSGHMGVAPDPRRFRANLWVDGTVPWEEEEWPGRVLRIGETRLRVVEPIWRCLATAADPRTGTRNAPTMETMERVRGDTTFGVYAEVIAGGTVATGDSVTVERDTPPGGGS